jgi:lysophospholipase L1-like esterase
MRKAILALTLAVLSQPGHAKSIERSEVIATIDAFFRALGANDAAGLERLYLPDAHIAVRRQQADGSWIVRTRSGAEDVARARTETRQLVERYWNPKITVHQGIATAWMHYSFDIDGKRSHCGVDAFDLVKQDGTWRIAALMYTVETDGCPKRR